MNRKIDSYFNSNNKKSVKDTQDYVESEQAEYIIQSDDEINSSNYFIIYKLY